MPHERSHTKETKYIRLESGRCEACWECLEACPLDVLGKVDLVWHRHAKIREAGACNGCKKCVRACESGALTYIYVPPARSAPDRTDSV